MCAAQPNGSLYDLDPWDQPISHVDLEVHGSSESAAMALRYRGSTAVAEGFKLVRLLKGAGNMPGSSFETQ